LKKDDSRKLDNLEILLTTLTKTHLEFRERKADILERLNQLIPSSQIFTLRQKKVLEDMVNISELAEQTLNILNFYDQTRYITDALIRYYEVLPECQAELQELHDIQDELGILYLIIQLMLRTPTDEVKMIDEHLTYISEILSKRMQKRGNYDNEVMRVIETKKRKEFDKTKMERQVRKFLSSKRYAREQLLGLDPADERLTGLRVEPVEVAVSLEDLAMNDHGQSIERLRRGNLGVRLLLNDLGKRVHDEPGAIGHATGGDQPEVPQAEFGIPGDGDGKGRPGPLLDLAHLAAHALARDMYALGVIEIRAGHGQLDGPAG
jgi:hypothetical protein